MHAGVIITRNKTVHDGKTAYQRIKNKKPSNKMLPFGETEREMESRLDDAEGQTEKDQAGFDSSVRSVRRYRAKIGRVLWF